MEKKTVLISGGTSGIGLASARLCARAGMNVVINGRNEERGLQALHEVEPFGNVMYVKGDVTVEDDCQRMVEAAVSTFGNLTGWSHRRDTTVKNYWKTKSLKKFAVFLR